MLKLYNEKTRLKAGYLMKNNQSLLPNPNNRARNVFGNFFVYFHQATSFAFKAKNIILKFGISVNGEKCGQPRSRQFVFKIGYQSTLWQSFAYSSWHLFLQCVSSAKLCL